jgi:hypothetical protein
MTDFNNLPRKTKVLLYVMKQFEDMIDRGIMSGSKVMTEFGHKFYDDHLVRQKFEPTEEEIEWAVGGLMAVNWAEFFENSNE